MLGRVAWIDLMLICQMLKNKLLSIQVYMLNVYIHVYIYIVYNSIYRCILTINIIVNFKACDLAKSPQQNIQLHHT